MLNDEVLDKVIDRVTRRIEKLNTDILEQIGKSIAKIGKLTPSKAQQLGELIKWGGDYDKIVKELARITNLNVQDIYKIFEEVARTDYEFAKQFYDYRNKKFIPYKDNVALQNEIEAIARETAFNYLNISNSYALKILKNGKYVNTPLSVAFQETLDKAILSVTQGESTFQEQMYQTIKELASSGLKTIEYNYVDSDGNVRTRTRRLDSAVEMNLKDGLRKLHNRIEEITGEEFGANGVEISVHAMPADDHQDAQGRQFSKEEYDKLQMYGVATTYDGKEIDLHRELKSGKLASSFRPISTMNCYHYIFAIVLGVSNPEYSNAELERLKRDNEKGFELDGKHYTLYEGTQLQRNIELELRKQKDTQIMAKASGNMELVQESQQKITQLTNKYREVTQISGLPSKLDRARVYSGKTINTHKDLINKNDFKIYDIKAPALDYPKIGEKDFNFKGNSSLNEYVLQSKNMYERMQKDTSYKEKMLKLANDMEELKTPLKENIVLYSGNNKDFNLAKSDFVISTSIGYQTAYAYAGFEKANDKVFTIYAEKGAKVISTYNTSNKQFNMQGEIIIPLSQINKLVQIGKYEYLYKK